MKKNIRTYSVSDFSKNFSAEQRETVAQEVRLYDMLTSLKTAREDKGFSQDELAKRAKINRTTLSKIESGLRNATVDTLMKVAHAMDMRLSISLHAK